MRSMESGALARLEELTRVPADVQDTLISILSEKTLPIPESQSEMRSTSFNLIATANNKDPAWTTVERTQRRSTQRCCRRPIRSTNKRPLSRCGVTPSARRWSYPRRAPCSRTYDGL